MSKIRVPILALFCIGFACFPAIAGDFDGSVPLICATIESFECGEGADCQRGSAQSINLPQFLKINFKEKMITGTLEGGEVRTAKFKNKELLDGKLILQGVQNGKPWSILISEANGKMTLTAADEQGGFIVFGACTPR